jgi:hypothetical protein
MDFSITLNDTCISLDALCLDRRSVVYWSVASYSNIHGGINTARGSHELPSLIPPPIPVTAKLSC